MDKSFLPGYLYFSRISMSTNTDVNNLKITGCSRIQLVVSLHLPLKQRDPSCSAALNTCFYYASGEDKCQTVPRVCGQDVVYTSYHAYSTVGDENTKSPTVITVLRAPNSCYGSKKQTLLYMMLQRKAHHMFACFLFPAFFP